MDFHDFPMILGNLGVEGDHPPRCVQAYADLAGAQCWVFLVGESATGEKLETFQRRYRL